MKATLLFREATGAICGLAAILEGGETVTAHLMTGNRSGQITFTGTRSDKSPVTIQVQVDLALMELRDGVWFAKLPVSPKAGAVRATLMSSGRDRRAKA